MLILRQLQDALAVRTRLNRIPVRLPSPQRQDDDELERLRFALARSAFMRSSIDATIAGSNGGFASKEPRVGENSKKEPSEPNAASVSGNAEQKRG